FNLQRRRLPVELEVRFRLLSDQDSAGRTHFDRSTQLVPAVVFYRVMEYFREHYPNSRTESRTKDVIYSNNVRMTLDTGTGHVSWLGKDQVYQKEQHQDGVRLSMATEQTATPVPSGAVWKLQRTKDRTSFTVSPQARLDLTVVTT